MCEIPAESREREKVELMVKSDICKRRKNIQGTQKENDLFFKESDCNFVVKGWGFFSFSYSDVIRKINFCDCFT